MSRCFPPAAGTTKPFVAVMLLSFTAADEDGTAISLAMRDFVGIDLGPKTGEAGTSQAPSTFSDRRRSRHRRFGGNRRSRRRPFGGLR
jgi:hypothetical protein